MKAKCLTGPDGQWIEGEPMIRQWEFYYTDIQMNQQFIHFEQAVEVVVAKRKKGNENQDEGRLQEPAARRGRPRARKQATQDAPTTATDDNRESDAQQDNDRVSNATRLYVEYETASSDLIKIVTDMVNEEFDEPEYQDWKARYLLARVRFLHYNSGTVMLNPTFRVSFSMLLQNSD